MLCRRSQAPASDTAASRRRLASIAGGALALLIVLGIVALKVSAPSVPRSQSHQDAATPPQTVSTVPGALPPAPLAQPTSDTVATPPVVVDYSALVNRMNPGGTEEAIERARSIVPRRVEIQEAVKEVRSQTKKPALVVVYTTDCEECEMLLNDLAPIILAHRDRIALHIWSAERKDDDDKFREMATRYAYLFDPVRIFGHLTIKRFPYVALRSKQGRLVKEIYGYYELPKLVQALEASMGCNGGHAPLGVNPSPKPGTTPLALAHLASMHASGDENSPRFASALNAARESFQWVTEGYAERFTINKGGHGVDGIRISQSEYGRHLVVAAPEGVRWSLVPHRRWDDHWPQRELSGIPAPWPWTHRAVVTSLFEEQIRATEHVVLFWVEGGAPVDVYVGAQSHIINYSPQLFRMQADPVLRLEAAVRNSSTEDVLSAIKGGATIKSVPVLAYALSGKWPLAELDFLLELGADVNERDGTMTPLCLLTNRLHGGINCSKDAEVAAAVRKLVLAGADANARCTSQDATALDRIGWMRCPATEAALRAGQLTVAAPVSSGCGGASACPGR